MRVKITFIAFSISFILSISISFAQFLVRGRITDSNSNGLPGVSIAEKGTSNGTTTDPSGTYSLVCKSATSTLIFSFVGFHTDEINVQERDILDVILLEDITTLMTIEVVGSRNINRSAMDSPVGIDIIDLQPLISNTGQLDINQLLQVVAPSYNANIQSGADGADHIDPASIRGMGPDQTLVLINGKRRHQSSSVNIYGSRGRGNTGTDLNSIPVAAIERIEILRDGASAQYGSDAIAGVVNIVLKSGINELNGVLSYGMRNARPHSTYNVLRDRNFDGESVQASLNYGLEVGGKGFVNITSEFLGKDFTNRPTDPAKYDVYRRKFGDAALDNYRVIFNANIPVNNNSDFYAFGGYNFRYGRGYAFTRGAGENWNVDELYPNGSDPLITSRITDKSLSMGIRSNLKGWNVDLNNTFGVNRFNFIVDETQNASLLTKSPARFDAGGYQLSQNTTSLNFTKFFKEALQGINIAFGTEYRIDNYQIFAGEEASYKNYGIVDSVDANGFVIPVDTLGRPAGSQGFPGFSPDNELNEVRQNLALYFDNEINFIKSFMVGAALRFEKYSDFGNTLNGKLATRLELSKNIALRASVSSGFRAPSLAQIYYNTTYSDVAAGEVLINIIAKNNSPLTKTLGIPRLKQEESLNFSTGFTFQSGDFSATLDGYYVNVHDRIVLTGNFYSDDSAIGNDLQKLNISAARFFTNAVNTTTRGADVVFTYAVPISRNSLKFSYAGNFNSMEIGDIQVAPKLVGKEDVYFGKREQYFLLASAPKSKMNLSSTYKTNKFSVYIRAVRYGALTLRDFFDENDEEFSSKITLDATLGYQLTPSINISIGGTNIFNAYPDQHDASLTETGGVWEAVQMGFSGAFYFTKLVFKL